MADVSCEEYNFVESPPQEYFCPVSFAVLLEPYQTRCCGNHLSQEAYQRLRGQACPVCKEKNLTAMDDKFHKRRVMSLKVRCPHEAEGCEWEGELGSLEQHLDTTTGVCRYVVVNCPYSCGESIHKHNLEEHKSQHCALRPFTCQYCNLHKANYQEVTEEHWPTCEKYPVSCPNDCWEEKIERQQLKQHLEQTCPLELVECEFSCVGCVVRLQRCLMSAHMAETNAHLSMVAQLSKNVPELKHTVHQQADQIKQQADQIKQQGDQIKQQTDLIKQQGDQIKQQEDQIKQQEDQIKQDREQIKQQGDQIKQLELFVKEQEFVFLNPPVYVIMNGFKEHRNKDDTWYSLPFYSHLGGYKMCLRVDANGTGNGKGTHVSVFVYLMRGNFDDHVKWPFCGNITVQLHNDACCFERVIPMNQDAVLSPRCRPIAERNESGYGHNCYISHQDIYTAGYNYGNTLKFSVASIS